MSEHTYRHNKLLTPRAKELRKNMTPQEKKLWYGFFRAYPVRVLRQKVIDRFIVEFYCAKAKLVIEIDGGQHYSEEGLEYDKERTLKLEKFGLTVIRFSNREIDQEFRSVCESIDACIKQRVTNEA